MGKLNIRKSFEQKKFKYGGYATLLTMIVLAIVVAVNLVVDQLNLKLDLTKEKMFSLSEQTYKVLDEMKSDVKIIALSEAGKENTFVKELLDKYKAKGKKITVENVDPVLHPNFAQKYVKDGENLSTGSLIVESGSKFKIIESMDLFNYSYSEDFTQAPQAESVAAEQKITNAILFVTGTKNPVVYTLQGHNEEAVPYEITKALEDENFIVKTLDLVTGEWKPEKDDILFVNAPKRDISTDELAKIKTFLGNGGRAYFLTEYANADMPNMKALLEVYGVSLQKAVIFEGDTANMYQNKIILLPNRKDHAIMDPIIAQKLPVFIPQAQPIEDVKVRKSSIKIEPLLTTSAKAYAKKSTDYKTTEKEAADISGPFNVAVAVTDNIDPSDETKATRIVIVSSPISINSQILASGGNMDLFMNGMNWMVEKKESVSIRPKSLAMGTITINVFQGLVIAGLVVIVIPLLVAGAGVTVWLRRRHL